MNRRISLTGVVAAWTLAAFMGLAASAESATPLPTAIRASCPKSAPAALPADAIARATDAALSQAHLVYRSTDLTGMRATAAVLAPFNGPRGGYAAKCGGTVRARTVVVELQFPAMQPSTSLSQGVLLISRFAGNYRVWAVLH